MMIPGVVIGVGDLGPYDFDDARSRFDQSTRQQAALTKGIAAVTVAARLPLRPVKLKASRARPETIRFSARS